uniref:Uncharacterized protein n=2 Tax=Canis lupus familiaris TaxID=9615 RepID=A0A8C0TQI4_CANLF
MPWQGFQGAWAGSSPCQEPLLSFQVLPPSKQQFPEAMTCPCSWGPFREGHRGLLSPVLPMEEGRSSLGPQGRFQPLPMPHPPPLLLKKSQESPFLTRLLV